MLLRTGVGDNGGTGNTTRARKERERKKLAATMMIRQSNQKNEKGLMTEKRMIQSRERRSTSTQKTIPIVIPMNTLPRAPPGTTTGNPIMPVETYKEVLTSWPCNAQQLWRYCTSRAARRRPASRDLRIS